MAKISMTELSEMVKSKLMEKGLSENDVNQDIINTISEKIKGMANEDYRLKAPKAPEPIKPEVVNVDVSSQDVPSETPGGIPNPIIQSTIENPESEALSRKEGELTEKERNLEAREMELARKEEELREKSEQLAYKPEMPEVLEKIGPEQLFVFDMSKLSSGAENLSSLPMKLMDNPETETNMKDLWLNKAKKKAEVYVVKFEKVGEVEFNPIEGTSNLTTIRDMNGDKELSDFQNGTVTGTATGDSEHPDDERAVPTNMKDGIQPLKDVTQPMSNDRGLSVDNNLELEELIKKHIEEMMLKQSNA